jgi:hypothetical protein
MGSCVTKNVASFSCWEVILRKSILLTLCHYVFKNRFWHFLWCRIRTIRIRFFLDLCGHKFVALPQTLLNRDLLHYFIWRMIKTCPTVKSKFRCTSWMLSLAAGANYLYMCCCLLEYYSVPLLFVCFWLPTLSIPIVIRTWVNNNNNKYFTNVYMR